MKIGIFTPTTSTPLPMKSLRTLVLLCFTCCMYNVSAQFLNISPNNSDFCTGTFVTYTAWTPAPGNDIMWNYVDYSNYSFSGQEITSILGYGTVLNINATPGGNCPGGFIRALEIDPLGNIVTANSVAMLSSVATPLNSSIPIYAGQQFSSCIDLSVPPCFDPFSTIPYSSTHRWAMWYKNGVATGVSSYYLSGPLSDSAWYEYKVRLTCGDTLSTGLFYFWQPSTPVISAGGSTTFCTGDTVVLTVSSSSAIEYWIKDGITIPGSNAKTSIKATQAGVYNAVIKSSSYCYINSNPITVNVNPGAFITSPVNQACNGDSVQLSCTAAGTYLWKRNGVTISGATTQSIWVKQSGNYQVITTGLTCNSSYIKTITFYANPSVSISPTGSVSMCNGNVLSLNAAATNTASYAWYRSGAAMPGGNTANLVVTKAGNYKCVVSNVIGCTRTSSIVSVAITPVSGLPQKTVMLQPGANGKDAYITSAFGNYSTNFGYTQTIEVSNWHKYFRTAERGYLEFDLSSIPANSPIVSASLKLWLDTINQKNVNVNLPNAVYFKRNTQAWNENTLNWNNSPDSTEFQSVAVPCSLMTSKSYVTANILDLMKHWSFRPAERFGMIVQLSDYNHITWTSFASSDHPVAAYHPKLTVKYYYADILPSGPTNLCTGGSVSFSTNSGPYTYQWYKNGIAIGGATTANYTATSAGDYFVMLTDAAGCAVSSVTKTVTVNAVPVLNLTPSGTVNFCSGDTVLLTVDSLPGYTFQWKKNNVNISGAVYRKYAVTQSGTYTVKVTSSCGQFAKDSVVCNKIFNPLATITAGGPVTFCQGQSVTLTANTFAGVSYQWQKNGLNIALTSQSITIGGGGTYAVIESANGCTRISNSILVTVNCREGDFSNEIVDMEIYPIPVTGEAAIVLKGLENYDDVYFEVLDMNGKRLLRQFCSGELTQFSRAGFADGIYLIRALRKNEQLSIAKIVFAR